MRFSRGEAGSMRYSRYAESASGSSTAMHNTVSISGVTVGNPVYGGHAESDGGSATTTGNTVIISGGEMGGNVYGGHANAGTGGSNQTTATHNTVTLSGSPVFTGVDLYGGNIVATSGDEFTANTLNVWNYSGTTELDSVRNFEFYNFVFPVDQHDYSVQTSQVH